MIKYGSERSERNDFKLKFYESERLMISLAKINRVDLDKELQGE